MRYGTTRRNGTRLAVTACALTLGLTALPAAAQGQAGTTGTVVGSDSAQAVKGSYLVELAGGASALSGDATALAAEYDAEVSTVYRTAFDGYAVRADAEDAARLAGDPRVAAVYQDQVVTGATETQYDPPSWGLDRMDQVEQPLDGAYTYHAHGGDGATIYVLDTGIHYTHEDFGGRAREGFDTFGGDGSDDAGHGTHVASIAAGADHGVAKSADLVSVKVLDENLAGTTEGVVAGVDWVTEHAEDDAVVNMSLGGEVNPALDSAVERSIASGVHYVAAAGNENQNTANVSPAHVPGVIAVGATDQDDVRAEFSNWGALQVFAPGTDITAATAGGDTATTTASGTSAASPHVAGAVALEVTNQPGIPSDELWEGAMHRHLARGVVSDAGTGSPNLLIQAPRSAGAGGR